MIEKLNAKTQKRKNAKKMFIHFYAAAHVCKDFSPP